MTRTGHIISRHRRRLKLTQEELGRRLGDVSKQYIGKIENGEKALPVAQVRKLASILGLESRHLMLAMIRDYRDELLGREKRKVA